MRKWASSENMIFFHTEVLMQNSPQRSARNVQYLMNDDELMLMDVQAHSGQQQQCFRLSALGENVNGLFHSITIQFHELASQVDPQTAMKALLFCQIFFLNFLQFR